MMQAKGHKITLTATITAFWLTKTSLLVSWETRAARECHTEG